MIISVLEVMYVDRRVRLHGKASFDFCINVEQAIRYGNATCGPNYSAMLLLNDDGTTTAAVVLVRALLYFYNRELNGNFWAYAVIVLYIMSLGTLNDDECK